MNWLFPLYMAGAALIIAPILLHLRRRPPKDRVSFSSFMFLPEATPQPSKKRKLDHWLLLLARCLLLALLALMFARPFWRGVDPLLGEKSGDTVVLLVDRSASMQRGDVWKQAVEAAVKETGELRMEDFLAVGVFDDELRQVWGFTEDQAQAGSRAGLVRAKLDESKAGWGRSDLGGALLGSLPWFQESFAKGGKKRLIVVGDFQVSSNLDALQGALWPDDVALERVVVSGKEDDNLNLSLALVADRSSDEPTAVEQAVGPRFRVSASGGSSEGTFEVAWLGDDAAAVTQGVVMQNAGRVMRSAPQSLKPDGSPLSSTLVVKGDAYDFDNRIYLPKSQPRKVRILVAGDAQAADSASSPIYFLRRALQATAAVVPQVLVVGANEWTQIAPTAADVLVYSGDNAAQRLNGAALPIWKQAMEAGALAVYVADGEASAVELAALTSDIQWKVETVEAGKNDYAMLADVDAADPLLSPFADARLRDFTKIRFWKHRKLSAEGAVKTLARFDSQNPALLRAEVGQGKLLVLASGWHPVDSQLALSTKFVPLWFGWLAAAGYSHRETASVDVGQPISLPLRSEAVIRKPDGVEITRSAEQGFIPDMPGLYEVKQGGESLWFAAQVPAGEGRLAVLDETMMEEAGIKLKPTEKNERLGLSEEEMRIEDQLEIESQQRWWWWVLLTVLVLVGLETLLASRREPAVSPA